MLVATHVGVYAWDLTEFKQLMIIMGLLCDDTMLAIASISFLIAI